MKKEKIKKDKKHIVLKIIAVILGLWFFMTTIDLIRFFTSDKQISPIICIEYNGCKCYEWREEVSLGGYIFDYTYESEESYHNGKPDNAVCYFFGLKFERR